MNDSKKTTFYIEKESAELFRDQLGIKALEEKVSELENKDIRAIEQNYIDSFGKAFQSIEKLEAQLKSLPDELANKRFCPVGASNNRLVLIFKADYDNIFNRLNKQDKEIKVLRGALSIIRDTVDKHESVNQDFIKYYKEHCEGKEPSREKSVERLAEWNMEPPIPISSLIDFSKYFVAGEFTSTHGVKLNGKYEFDLLDKPENKDARIITNKILELRNGLKLFAIQSIHPITLTDCIDGYYSPKDDTWNFDLRGCDYIIYDDVITTGKSVEDCIKRVGKQPKFVICLVDRSAEAGVKLPFEVRSFLKTSGEKSVCEECHKAYIENDEWCYNLDSCKHDSKPKEPTSETSCLTCRRRNGCSYTWSAWSTINSKNCGEYEKETDSKPKEPSSDDVATYMAHGLLCNCESCKKVKAEKGAAAEPSHEICNGCKKRFEGCKPVNDNKCSCFVAEPSLEEKIAKCPRNADRNHIPCKLCEPCEYFIMKAEVAKDIERLDSLVLARSDDYNEFYEKLKEKLGGEQK